MENMMPYVQLNRALTEGEYCYELTRRMQEKTLNDPVEMSRMQEHIRKMELENAKNANRMIREEQRQKWKVKESKVMINDTGLILQTFNGANSLVNEERLFACMVKEVKVWKRVNTDELEWQIIIAVAKGSEQISPLYPWVSMTSIKKLQQTILSKYDCTVLPGIKKIAWNWMQKYLMAISDQVEPFLLPSNPGWFYTERSWRFWGNVKELSLLLNPIIRKYDLINETDENERSIASYLAEMRKEEDIKSAAGVLLIAMLLALLGRIADQGPVKYGIAIVGRNSDRIAKECLRVFDTSEDTINLDADRINTIRERFLNIQDSPLFFVSANPDSKSTQNRLREILGWLEVGHFEGKPVTIPFVFCLPNFSKDFPFDDFVVISTSAIEKGVTAEFLQRTKWLVLKAVESGGNYLVDQLRSDAKTGSEDRALDADDPTFSVRSASERLLLKLMSTDHMEECMREIFAYGEQEVQKQLFQLKNCFLDTFKEAVELQTKERQLWFINRKKGSETLDKNYDLSVFFDEEAYYFTKTVFKAICERARIDTKSILYLKQQLINRGFVKLYQSNGNYRRELEVDFSVCTTLGSKKLYSGLAIKRSFWDELGGAALYERG